MPARATSLIEIKKRQWAIEKAEDMESYNGIWKHFSNVTEPQHRSCIRSQFKSSIELDSYVNPPTRSKRTPSLPPINSNYDTLPQTDEGDTSGYASDSAGYDYQRNYTNYNRKTPEERLKWGDRGVGIGHLWSASPHLPEAALPLVDRSTPAWLNRKLREPAQILMISHEDISSEPEKNFMRGQNAPLDPQVESDREKRRQKALDQYNAIKLQVEEKERKNREEQARLEKEERLAEERLRMYEESENKRIEIERQKQEEKAKKEERIAKAMKEALEIAERSAKEEKSRRRKHLRKNTSPLRNEIENEKLQESEKSDSGIDCINIEGDEEKYEEKEIIQTDSEIIELDIKELEPESEPEIKLAPLQEPEEQNERSLSLPDIEISELSISVNSLRIEPEEIESNRLRILPSPGRVLTPTLFRERNMNEKSTQTESRKVKRTIRVEDRPKWGVNRPTARYIKASDRDPFRRKFRNDSRSPSPLHRSKYSSFSPLTSHSTTSSSSETMRRSKVSKSVGTPRTVQILPNTGTIRKSSAGRKYLSLKGKTVNRLPSSNILPKRPDLSDLLTVKEVLSQLTALKQGLKLKEKEWAITRSPTPFSEVSSIY